ncbi:hypothetical protein PISMIDRAFT_9647 [Pisolithus microcarpus 441]|uniref:Uncharacterized protein n=1 Tax=Pisolithus microcarpus 441 TaxID=765257 RepID=A0A0C9ZGY3_9AGAM|nr:hypothetical protein PISMIDRAFT_9647 [Pisolithus microcarpus 441]
MSSSKEDVMTIAELGASGARADDMKSMKATVIDWITPKGQTLSPHIPRNVKDSITNIPAYKHIFTSPSSADQELRATRSGNACIHGMQTVTKASIAYAAMQAHFALTSTQVFSHTDLVTDLEQFYNSIMELLKDPNEIDEVELLIGWWNRQIFPLYTENECLPSKNSVLARICQKQAELKASATVAEDE